MNYKLSYKAEMIAEKMKKKDGSSMPATMFHGPAYDAIMNNKVSDWLSEEEIEKCDNIEEEKAQKVIDYLP